MNLIRKSILFRVALTAVIFFGTLFIAFGTAYTASVSGNWNDNATWGGSGHPSTTSDAATINSGITVTVSAANGNATCQKITNNGILSITGGTLLMGTAGTGGCDYTGSGTLEMSGGTFQVGHDFKPGSILPTAGTITGGTIEFLGSGGGGAFKGVNGDFYFYNVLIDAACTAGPGFNNDGANVIKIQGNLTIQSGGIADLPASESNTASTLTLGSTYQAAGYYGTTATTSALVPAGNKIAAFGTVNSKNAINVNASSPCSITLTSASGTNAQTVCLNSAITNITYSTTGATGATISGLPTGVTGNWASSVVTISGTPSTTSGSPFSYTVTLTGNSCSNTATGTITVNALPTTPAGLSNQTVCGNGNVIFTVTDPGSGYTVEWSTDGSTNNDGTGAGGSGNVTKTHAITVGSPITEYARISNNSTSCKSAWSSGYTGTANALPSAPVGLSNQSVCGNGNVTFTVTDPGTGFTVEWSTNGTTNNDGTGAGGSGNVTKPHAVTVGSPITEYARISNNTTLCKSAWSTGYTGTANTIPSLPTGLGNQTTACGNGNVTFTVTDPGAGFTVQWSTDGSTNNDGTGAGGSGNLTKIHAVTVGAPITEYARISNTTTLCTSAWSSGYTGTATALPTITLGLSPSVCKGSASANLPVITTTGSPNQYSIVYDATAHTAGFTDVTNASLTSPIPLTVPTGTSAVAGVYHATITVRNSTSGCSSNSPAPFTVTINQVSVIPAITQPTCFIAGSIAITASGGTAPYTYDWADLSGSSNPQNRSGLSAGTYSVIVTDANGCSASSGTLTLITPVCAGVNVCSTDIASVFSVAPDPANTSYTWTIESVATPGTYYNGSIIAGQNSASITIDWTSVPVGAYNICTVAHNVCGTATQTCQIVNVNKVIASASATPACEGGNLQLFASGGISYSWTGPNGFTSSSANPIISGATSGNAGTYTVTATGQYGCTATASVSVVVNPAPQLNIVHILPACNQSTGTITLSTSSGTSPYTWLWSNGTTTESLTGVPSGVYTVVATDAKGCTATLSDAVGNANGPDVTAIQTNVSCAGGSDGSITPAITGTGGYSFLWTTDNGSGLNPTAQNQTGLKAGTYSVVVTDINGCKGALTVIISEPTPILLDHTQTNVSCFSGTNGAINLLVSGGSGNFNYAWTKNGTSYGGNTQNLTNLGAGTYAVVVSETTNSSCNATTTVIITQPSTALGASATATPAACHGGNDGQIVISVSGGTSPYTYAWTASNGGSIPAGESANQNLTGLVAGTYNVTVTDAKGCTYSLLNNLVTEPAAISLTSAAVTSPITCNGGTATVTISATGGTTPLSYTFNGETNQTGIFSGVSSGTALGYSITDANNCGPVTGTINVTQPPVITLTSATVTSPVACNGGTATITLVASGGTAPITYSFNGQTNQTGLFSGVLVGNGKIYTITDANNCGPVTGTIDVAEPATIAISGEVTDVKCNGAATGEIHITASGGAGSYSYSWSDGPSTSADRTGLVVGTYTVTVKDINNCSKTADYTIVQPSALSLSMANSNISCNGGNDGSIDLTVTGGVSPYSYSWSPAGVTTEDITNLTAGTYTATVQDANGCISHLTSEPIAQPDALILTPSIITNVTCKGGNNGSLTANSAGGTSPYSYLWSNGSTDQTATGLTAGTYTFTITDSKGCTVSGSETISEPSTTIELFATTIDASACGGSTGSISLTVQNGSGPYTFSWSGPTAIGNIQNPTNLVAGIYEVTVTDNLGCSATLNNITVGTAPALSVTATVSNPTCSTNDGAIYAVVTGGVAPYTYLWSPGGSTSESLTGINSGTYTVSVTDANGCKATSTSVSITPPSCVPPETVNDFFTSCEGALVTKSVATNDSPGTNSGYTLSDLVFLPLNSPASEQGSISWDPSFNGDFIFTPTPGYNGTVLINYQVSSPNGLSANGILTIYVSSMTAQVTAENITYATCGTSNGSATITVTPNASSGFGPYSYSTDGIDYTNNTGSFSGLAAGTNTIYVKDSKGCFVSTPVTIEDVCLTIIKTITAGGTYSAAGDVVHYSYKITNSGNVTLAGPFAVTDDKTTVPTGAGPLAPGAFVTVTATYTITQGDVNAGSVINHAFATTTYAGNTVTSNTDTQTATASQTPELTII